MNGSTDLNENYVLCNVSKCVYTKINHICRSVTQNNVFIPYIKSRHFYFRVTHSLKMLDDATVQFFGFTEWPPSSEGWGPLDYRVLQQFERLLLKEKHREPFQSLKLLQQIAAARVRAQVRSCGDLWWTKWHWGRFSPSTSVSPANLHSTDCSIFIIIHNPGLVQ
jgi:hypothetical protein